MPSLASKSSGAHQVSLIRLSMIIYKSVSLLIPFFPTVKGLSKKTSFGFCGTTAAVRGGRGAGCSSPGSLLVTCCEGSEVTDQPQPLGAKLASSLGWEICHIMSNFSNRPTRPEQPEEVSAIQVQCVLGPKRTLFLLICMKIELCFQHY